MEVAQVTEGRNPFAPPESIADQIRRNGRQSIDDMRCDEIWESEAELYEFLEQQRRWRRFGLG